MCEPARVMAWCLLLGAALTAASASAAQSTSSMSSTPSTSSAPADPTGRMVFAHYMVCFTNSVEF